MPISILYATSNNPKLIVKNPKFAAHLLPTTRTRIINMSLHSSNANSIQTSNNLDGLKFKNRKYIKHMKKQQLGYKKQKQVKKSYSLDVMTSHTTIYSLIMQTY